MKRSLKDVSFFLLFLNFLKDKNLNEDSKQSEYTLN